MIKINLLPVRREKKKAQLLKHLEIGGVLILIVLAGIAFVWYQKKDEISLIKAEIEAGKIEQIRLQKIIREVKKLEKKKEFIGQRLDIINQLKKEQTGPVRILDHLSLNIPEKMWLTSVSEKDAIYSIKGFALTNQDIADFMKRMEKTRAFNRIELISSQQSEIEKEKVMDFALMLAAK